MPVKVEYIPTPEGIGRRCRCCGEVKPLEEFVKDARLANGRGQPCTDCKVNMDRVRRLNPEVHRAAMLAKQTAKKKKPAAKPKRTAKKSSAEVEAMFKAKRERGGAASKARLDEKRDTHPQPQTPFQHSQLLYAKAGKALKESWEQIDPDEYKRSTAVLTSMFPDKDASDYTHQLFQSYAQGIIARYGG